MEHDKTNKMTCAPTLLHYGWKKEHKLWKLVCKSTYIKEYYQGVNHPGPKQ